MATLTGSWPRLADYNTAFLKPASGLIPDYLRTITVGTNAFGLPQPVSGGFALIYDVTDSTGKRIAVRCFTESQPARDNRVSKILERLKETLQAHPEAADYFVRAEWVSDCIRFGNRNIPAVIMDWVEGHTLGTWLEHNYEDSSAVRRLRKNLASLGETLKKAGIAHGDLQTGNILVEGKGSLKLIDYDGIRLFDETSLPAGEQGHPDFQHPDRRSDLPPELTDRFSLLVMYFGLSIIEARPDLYDEYSTGENILFTRDDFLFPETSALLSDLSDDERFQNAADIFSVICIGAAEEVPTITDFYAFCETGIETPKIKPESITVSPVVQKREAVYQGPYPVIRASAKHEIELNIGRMLEVIGRITDIHTGYTKYGKPYAFINFGDFKEGAFRLVIWSEGLENLGEEPDSSWIGSWVSVMGLIDEPYVSRYGVESCSITVLDSSQIRFINRETARYRLGEIKRTAPVKEPPAARQSSNRDILEGITDINRDIHRTISTSQYTPASSTPSNVELLKKLGESQPSAVSTTKHIQPVQPTAKKPEKKNRSGCLVFILVVVCFLLAMLAISW